MYRKEALGTDRVYHIFDKSIAGFKIFHNKIDFGRIISAMQYYQVENPLERFARFAQRKKKNKEICSFNHNADQKKLVEIIAYCIMPTHIHLILKQLNDKGISTFMGNILNSYARYFNTKFKRKGPLWEGRFKNVLVDSDEQILHLTRYIHLNPVTACLTDKAENWEFSSYREYISHADSKLCYYEDLLDIQKESYRQFVEDRALDQRDLADIKRLMFDE